MDNFEKAYEILRKAFPNYTLGIGCLKEVGKLAKSFGDSTLLIANTAHMQSAVEEVEKSLKDNNVKLSGGKAAPGAKPNAPREDVYRLVSYILDFNPDSIIALGGGSTIDTAKAASILATLGKEISPEIDEYFGTGKVSEYLNKTKKKLIPLIAVQTSASSGSHLTKYSNITDPVIGQKKLIVDNAIVPSKAVFDYSVTKTMPIGVTIDGALDAISHTFEVFLGAKEEYYDKAEELCTTSISLVLEYTPIIVKDPSNIKAREAIGLATDLGGYAIMVGGTSGGHMTSFSLVDCVGHGTACGVMNPYYAVFYSKAIQRQLKTVGKVYKKYGYTNKDIDALSGRELSEAVAEAMIAFNRAIGAPTKLTDIEKFNPSVHIPRALKAAHDPDLKMKLQNMPVSMTADDVDEYMKPILEAAAYGDFKLIKEMP